MYNKVNWVNNSNPAINQDNLGNMDNGIYNLDQLLVPENNNNASGQHNNLYQYKNILTDWDNGTVSTNIANGTFKDIYPGNYFVKTVNIDGTSYNLSFMFADLDTFYGGYTNNAVINTHHVGVIVWGLPNARMNETNTTVGGYAGSEMHTVTLPKYLAAIKEVLGETHIVKHNKIYSNSINATGYNRYGTNSGCSNNWAWVTDQEISLLTESQVYGHPVWSSSGYDTGEAHRQLSIFRSRVYNRILGNRWFWLRDVASASNFAGASPYGYATGSGASSVNGVVPLLLLK